MSRALDREVTYVPIELDEFAAILHGRGAPDHLIQHLLAVAVDYRNGVFAGTNDLVKTIGGSDPSTSRVSSPRTARPSTCPLPEHRRRQ